MKICDLTQFYSPVSGGVKRYICEKVAYMHEFAPEDEHILVIPGDKDELVTRGKSKTYSIRSPLISKTSRYRALLRLAAVEDILEREKPTVIESGDPYQMAWKALASGHALRIPVVGFYHSHFPEAYLRSTAKFFGPVAVDLVMDMAQRYVRNLYNRFARTMVPAPALGALLEEWGVRNVTNIDLGVNTRIFTPEPDDAAATRAAQGIAPDRVLLLYVGRLAREKNTRTLFDAFEILAREHPGRFHLLAIGDGTQRAELKELQAHTGAVSWVSYCGNPSSSRNITGRPISSSTPACRRPSASSRSRARRAARPSWASAGATWIESSTATRLIGPAKTPRPRSPRPSSRAAR